jgi:hypothetical protein
MSRPSSVVAIYETHTQAEEAVKELQRSRPDSPDFDVPAFLAGHPADRHMAKVRP